MTDTPRLTAEEIAEGRALYDECRARTQIHVGEKTRGSLAALQYAGDAFSNWLCNHAPTLLAAAERDRHLRCICGDCLPGDYDGPQEHCPVHGISLGDALEQRDARRTELKAAAEREAGNTDTDPRWLAASELRRMAKWEDRTLMCEIDQASVCVGRRGGEAMSFQDDVTAWDHGQLVREVLRLRTEIETWRTEHAARAIERDRALDNCTSLEGQLSAMQRLKDEANVALASAEMRLGTVLENPPSETHEHALHDFLRDAARHCFDECNRIASRWYGPDGRPCSEAERGIAKELGALAERLQNLVRIVYNEYHSPGNGWRT